VIRAFSIRAGTIRAEFSGGPFRPSKNIVVALFVPLYFICSSIYNFHSHLGGQANSESIAVGYQALSDNPLVKRVNIYSAIALPYSETIGGGDDMIFSTNGKPRKRGDII